MIYAPQSWLADWSAMTDALTKGERQMKGMHHEEYIEETEAVSLLDGEFDRNCNVCGRRFITTRRQAFMCPECRSRKRHEAGATGGKNAHATWKRKHVGGTPHDVKADDVPDVPADDYDTLEEKIWKTAPIETVLVPKKEDNMDTERAERLKTFPSLSNMTEHPEYFTGDAPEDLKQTTTVPADNGTEDVPKSANAARMERHKILKALAMDKRGTIMSLYSTVCDISGAIETPVAELLDRMNRIDAALS